MAGKYLKTIGAITATAAVLTLTKVWFGWDIPPWLTKGRGPSNSYER